MPILTILHYPDPRLNVVAHAVTTFDETLNYLINSMAETMYSAHGVGLAAPQVDVRRRVIVVDISEDKSSFRAYVNPQIDWRSKVSQVVEEGCLSVPGIYETTPRPDSIRGHAYDVHGARFEFEAEGLLARCIQHEMDHLDGTVFVERLSPLKRNRIRARLQKSARGR
jgi:peptide deformylase